MCHARRDQAGFSEPLLQLCKQNRSWSRCQDVPLAPLLQHLRRSRIFLCQSGLACFEKASTAAEKLGNVHQYTGTAGLQASRATLPRKQPFRGWHCRVSPVMPSLARLPWQTTRLLAIRSLSPHSKHPDKVGALKRINLRKRCRQTSNNDDSEVLSSLFACGDIVFGGLFSVSPISEAVPTLASCGNTAKSDSGAWFSHCVLECHCADPPSHHPRSQRRALPR